MSALVISGDVRSPLMTCVWVAAEIDPSLLSFPVIVSQILKQSALGLACILFVVVVKSDAIV